MEESTLKYLRDALNNLYDSEHLRANPLAEVLGTSGRSEPALAVQKALENLIQAMKPRPGEASRSQKRRMYDLLYSRYVDQFSQKEVADQLGISISTYQREQRVALEFLAALLVEKYPAAAKLSAGAGPDLHPGSAQLSQEVSAEEFSWMFSASVDKSSQLAPVVESARLLVKPLLNRYSVDLKVAIDPVLPKVAIHPEALLQVLIHLLSIGVHYSTCGSLECWARAEDWETTVTFKGCASAAGARVLSGDDAASLEVARKLVELADGSLHYDPALPYFQVIVRLPTLELLPVLVIDDSADNIKLLQRYLGGTRYQMSSLREPEQALNLIEQAKPQIVILDLMMPGVDGLEILTRLHSNPATCQIPVVVCTILPQEELALSLGASAFLHKPVMQENLLAVLDRLASAREPGAG